MSGVFNESSPTQGLVPDLTVLLDIAPGAGRGRRDGGDDRLEAEPDEFHGRVRERFLGLARSAPARYLVLDATLDPAELHRAVVERLAAVLPESPVARAERERAEAEALAQAERLRLQAEADAAEQAAREAAEQEAARAEALRVELQRQEAARAAAEQQEAERLAAQREREHAERLAAEQAARAETTVLPVVPDGRSVVPGRGSVAGDATQVVRTGATAPADDATQVVRTGATAADDATTVISSGHERHDDRYDERYDERHDERGDLGDDIFGRPGGRG